MSARRTVAVPLLALGLLALTCAVAWAASPPSSTRQETAGWTSLFDGKDLQGWRASEHPDSFQVRDGSIIVKGPRAHLYYVGPVANHAFVDFELQLDVLTFPGSNSGVYFHTDWQDVGWPARGYEVQVNNSHADPKRTGGLYGIRDVATVPAKDGTWFTLVVRVQGQRIRTYVDGRLIADYTEEANPERPAEFRQRVLGSGTFALQAHDPDSEVHYRNIKVRLLP